MDEVREPRQSRRKPLIIIGALVLLIIAASSVSILLARTAEAPPSTSNNLPTKNYYSKAKPAQPTVKFGVFASGLDTPWAMTFLPDGDMLVTERPGQIQRIGADKTIFNISGVHEYGEGGLLGLALSPDFAQNHELYLYLTTNDGSELHNRVDLYSLNADKLSFIKTILANIPAAIYHDGGGIKFGPDGKLYVTTGDAKQPDLAQDKNSLAGKILRMNPDGSAPKDNPFGNLVWSYGHRNAQGIAWDDQGRMWATEHGPTITGSGQDELNLTQKGGNYGWPIIRGDETHFGMTRPVIQSGSATWAPSGLAYADGSLFFAGLKGETLYQARVNKAGKVTKIIAHFTNLYGRLRAVTVHSGVLYFSTSNRDGRGTPKPSDDKIFQAPLSMFK